MRGIHTALVTPFTDSHALDLAALEACSERQIDAGIDGLVACGTTGESPTLSEDEWREVVRTVVRVSAGRVPVTAGVGTNDTRTTVRRVEQAREAGADAGLLVFPYYNKPNPEGLRNHVKAALEPGLPLVLYHVPGRTGQVVPAPLLSELADFDGVMAVKEASGDLRYGGDLLERTDTPVLSGDDFTFLPLLSLGGTGCISVLSNVAPQQTLAVQQAFEAGHHQDAIARMRRLWPLVTFLFSSTNPVPCKAAMAELGLCRPDVRLPLAAWDGPSPRDLLDRVLA